MTTLPKPSLQRPGGPSQSTRLGVGLGDGFSRAFEFAATPAVFGVIGYFVDRWLDCAPFATVGFTVFAVVGMFLKMWLDYDATMRIEQAKTIEAKKAADDRYAASLNSDHPNSEQFGFGSDIEGVVG